MRFVFALATLLCILNLVLLKAAVPLLPDAWKPLEFISVMGNFAGAWVFVIVGLVPRGSDE